LQYSTVYAGNHIMAQIETILIGKMLKLKNLDLD